MPILIVGSAVLIVAVRFVAPAPSGAVHSELAHLQTANEITGFALMIVALASAYLLLAPDIHDEFESLTAAGGSRPVTFAAGRVVACSAWRWFSSISRRTLSLVARSLWT